MQYATRINSHLSNGNDVFDALKAIGQIEGIDFVDMNYPEHFEGQDSAGIANCLQENGLRLNAINMRFRGDYINGVFTNRDQAIRESAVQLCKTAADLCEQMGGRQVIVWLSYDGNDYPFQLDYAEAWANMVECFQKVCDAAGVPVSIEYKPHEERSYAFLDSYGTTMLMLKDVGRDNLGVTIDLCHMLMKHENPAFAVAQLLEQGKLYNVHLNDGEGLMDDGLIAGAVTPWKLLEVYYYLKKYAYDGVIYFDTFPKREDAVEEAKANLLLCRRMEKLIDKLGLERIGQVIAQNDATAVMRMLDDTWA